ncbi:MAG: glycosyltransferase family 2 protein [Deltaproteobacteria bacterium]|nr:glycosyltransferase family 2 protein [Deltaproteobacteria bacterium]
MPELSVVIPAYNEQDRIVPTLQKTLEYLGNRGQSAEVCVVSDGSTDGTGRAVASFTPPENVELRFLEYHPNRGKGYAVAYGMTRAAGGLVLFMDADYSVPMEELEKAEACIARGADVAIASRALPESNVTHFQSLPRRLSAKVYTLVQNLWLGFSFPDTQCGFKLFTQKAAKDLFSRQKLSSVIFDAEILWLAGKLDYRVAQFPVTWKHADDSRIVYDSLRKSLFVFEELFRIKKLHPEF